MKKLVILLYIMIICTCCYAQSSTFAAAGLWSNSLQWTSGVPTLGVNAIITPVFCSVTSGENCNDLTLQSPSNFNIGTNGVLTVNGDLILNIGGSIFNFSGGTFILKGDIFFNGNRKVQIAGGLEFKGNFTTSL